ncbi:adapter-related protein complex 4 sigma 1 subunit [Dictyostelium discoideum AX4]|uniref:AP-4 complex subunit sigma n=2 Tax=Dictyostelium TaxID=5782 RepID=AP4S_DICDI|nr:adapter-related protein complex 4 sigma 1 subunit [Dictyostelium discoideum AX4]Q54NZ4.1 RecName: Full=AP-4 complex subunit sigma; AltName: Full=AP-4 adaptor complex subunit sigma; AltName: Full=Adaptor-related protein complex 4 subunit sigma; AltName: Full=Sigma subunit of AP-4; AltName: Full=Sigma4-adaptin [Dictyostelium discoideum]EAL64916.1 adapter-related protein complex 4 sigma 1 subunit [Dictyostelium discoideum AX4]|eukprot:XP_639923.1 adapter-related protein complex 4 sigma 1 subunit [Dictyostelium discoideum AX4]
MAIKYFLLVNIRGKTRLSQYYESIPFEERPAMESEIIRKCLSRTEIQCSFVEYKDYKVIYRKYATLFFIVGVDTTENELAILELIHNYVEILDSCFDNVIMFNLDKAHFILDEMVSNGDIVEISKQHILEFVNLLYKQE